MRFLKIFILLITCCLANALAQAKFESLGNPGAIVSDLKLDERRKLLMAATNEQVQVWDYEKKYCERVGHQGIFLGLILTAIY